MKYTYFYIDLFLALAMIPAFMNKKVGFAGRLKHVLPALAITAALFLVWDHFFVIWNVRMFNPDYISGLRFLAIPAEEFIFLLLAPMLCVFLYEWCRAYIPRDYIRPYSKWISWGLILVLLQLLIFQNNRLYTAVASVFLLFLLLLHRLVLRKTYMGRFYMGLLVSLVPFFLVDGLLTALPVVSYRAADTLWVRLVTIPVEDLLYNTLLLLVNITIYEAFVGDRSKKEKALMPENQQEEPALPVK